MSGAPNAHRVPDAVAPPPRHPRFPLLDGMRAIAVICVVVVHSWIAAGAPLVFPIGRRRPSQHRCDDLLPPVRLPPLSTLYRPPLRRAATTKISDLCVATPPSSILPAYWLVLTAVVLIPNLDATSGSLLSQYAFTFTIYGSQAYVCDSCALGQTWSLAVEMSFYLCLPLLVLATNWVAMRWRQAMAGKRARRPRPTRRRQHRPAGRATTVSHSVDRWNGDQLRVLVRPRREWQLFRHLCTRGSAIRDGNTETATGWLLARGPSCLRRDLRLDCHLSTFMVEVHQMLVASITFGVVRALTGTTCFHRHAWISGPRPRYVRRCLARPDLYGILPLACSGHHCNHELELDAQLSYPGWWQP